MQLLNYILLSLYNGFRIILLRKEIMLLLLLSAPWYSIAQNHQKTNILFLMDASFSMRKEWDGGTKWKTAVNTLTEIVDNTSQIDNVNIGLRLFGHLYDESESNCKDTRLELPIGKYTKERFANKIGIIRPKGITPIAYSLEKCVADFGEDNNAKNILILITDGEESCTGDPCKAAWMLQQKGIVLKPFVIGMALTEAATKNFYCIGQTINTASDKEFNQTLKNMVDESIAKTTLQVNLVDSKNKATETDVAMTLYDSETHIAKEHFIHTLNSRGNPDTITISPFFNYDIQIHTIPELWIKNVTLKRNIHNEVSVDAAQGNLAFKLQGVLSKTAVVDRIKCIIHQNDSISTVHVQKLNTSAKLLTGKYDLEILTLPRIFINNIQIDDNKTTHIEIPTPGILTMNKSYEYYGVLFMQEKGELKKIYDLKPALKQETIALQPGKYRIVYRAKFAKSGHNTIEKEFEILSGGSISLRL